MNEHMDQFGGSRDAVFSRTPINRDADPDGDTYLVHTSFKTETLAEILGGSPSLGDRLEWDGNEWVAVTPAPLPDAYLRDGSLDLTGDMDAGGNRLTNLGDPIALQDAVTVTWASAALAAYAVRSLNLGDLTDVVAAQANLGLGDAATKNVGTSSGTVAAGDHTHAVPPVPSLANLTDVDNSDLDADTFLVVDGADTHNYHTPAEVRAKLGINTWRETIEWPRQGNTGFAYYNSYSGAAPAVTKKVLGSVVLPPRWDPAEDVVIRLLIATRVAQASTKLKLDVEWSETLSSSVGNAGSEATVTREFDLQATAGKVWFEDFVIAGGSIDPDAVALSLEITRVASTADPTGNAPIICSGSLAEVTLT